LISKPPKMTAPVITSTLRLEFVGSFTRAVRVLSSIPPKMGAPRKATCQVGDTNFHAAENGGDRQSGFGPLDVGFSEIELDAAKNGGDVAALKILAGHAALQSAEDDSFVERSAGITCPRSGSRGSRAPLRGAPHDKKSEGDEHHGPKGSPAKVRDAQFIEFQNNACKQQENSPGTALGQDVHDASEDDEQGPEPPEAADRNDSEVIEKEGKADQNEDAAHNDATAAATAKVYADHHGTTARSRCCIIVLELGMNGAMNLIVKFILELFRVNIFLFAHMLLLWFRWRP